METIFYFLYDKDKKELLCKICRENKITPIELTYADLTKTLGELLQGKIASAKVASTNSLSTNAGTLKASVPAMYIQPELLIFSGLTDNRLDTFLAAAKAAQLPKISLKAIVTPTNYNWTVFKLTKELQRENSHFANC